MKYRIIMTIIMALALWIGYIMFGQDDAGKTAAPGQGIVLH